MTGEFKDMLHLYECGARGTAPVSKEYDAEKILVLAKQQGVLEMVLSALIQVGYDFDDLKKALTLGVYQNTQKVHFLHSKVKKLEENGIECCILKGISYAHIYPNSDLRRSGDVDILIRATDEKKALEILGAEGFSYTKRHSSYNETVCKHKNGGILEVHISPYDELRDKIMFKGIDLFIEPYRKMNALGCFDITVMGITDGLVFNALHSIKHFLSSGMGIRQVMDILMYMKYYKDEIGWSRFNHLMEKLKYKTFIDNCIGIGIKYLGFLKDELPVAEYSDEKVDLLLGDIETGGLFGYNDYERTKFYSQYIAFSTGRDKGQNIVGDSYLKSNALRKLFPKIIALYIKYPYSYKCKVLIPIAWCHRIFDYIFKRQKKTRSTMFEKRMKLLESLDII